MIQVYLEDIFKNFFDTISYELQSKDYPPAEGFYTLIINNKPLTKKQGSLAVALLEKYKTISKARGYDYTDELEVATWKNNFREIDLSKSASVEIDKDGKIVACLKFPYSLKTEFEKEFTASYFPWDSERRVRLINLYEINVIKLNEFLSKHQFEIHESFANALAEIEQIWDSQDDIIPHSVIRDGEVVLKNCPEDTKVWFDEHKTNDLFENCFIAKIMGYPVRYGKKPDDSFEKLVSSSNTNFYSKDIQTFFDVYKKINGKLAILLDRNSDSKEWISSFVAAAENNGIDKRKIKVCFRETETSKSWFNQWIKDQELGGKVSDGEIFIFQNSPPKWLFSEGIFVKIIATNLIHPATSSKTQDWLASHPCLVYINDLTPSLSRGHKIDKL